MAKDAKQTPGGALDGIRVVDFTDERSIYGAKLLADLGAEVVRPEPAAGDPLRRRGPRAGGASLWHAFFASNRILFTIADANGAADALRALIDGADIVLCCGADWHGVDLDVDSALQRRPELVVVDTTSFGREGPWRDHLAPDLVAGALGGAVATTGDADTPPLKSFGELNFMISGAYAAIAALSAWHARQERGSGQRVDVSVHECLVSCLEQVLMFYWYCERLQRPGQRVLPRQGAMHWSGAYTVMSAANGSIMITPTPDFDVQLAWLVEEDAHEDLIDPKYMEPENLLLRITRTMELLTKWVAGKEVEALFFEAQARHIPYGWVLPVEKIADNPQLHAREWYADYEVNGQSVRGTGAPYRFSATPWQMGAPEVAHSLADIGWRPRSGQATPGDGAVGDKRRPLEGVRILDFTHVLAGPFATRVLADMGADVVKVNSEERALGANDVMHPYYLMWNRNKRALALDMSGEAGRAIGRELAQQADVVIDNFSVGVLDRWGMGYDTISEANPGVIYVQMSGMGEGGPWSDFVTYAPTIHALSGLTHMTGVEGREDIGIGFSYNDHQAGLHGAVAILAGLAARRRTGRGQRVDISQFEVGVNFAGPSILDLFANGVAARPAGNKLPYDAVAPHNVYRCAPPDAESVADQRWIAIACMDDEQWHALCRLMGNPDWSDAAAYQEGAGRVAHAEEIDARIGAWTAAQDAYELMEICQAAGVPAGVVQDGIDLQERDPQLRGFFEAMTDIHPDQGPTWVDHLPIRFTGTPCQDYFRSRVLGEDTQAVLADWLGFDEQRLADANESGALR